MHRLFEIFDRAGFHPAVGLDRFAGRGIALVGVDADVHRRADRIAHPLDHRDVPIRVDAHLDLDGADAFVGYLNRFLFGIFDRR